MDTDKLQKILEKHRKWLRREQGGEWAYLLGANLSGTNLKKTIYENINWLAYIGIVPNARGKARAYKLITQKGEGPFNGGLNYLNTKIFSIDNINTDCNQQCGAGINLAIFAWCIHNRQSNSNRLLLMEFDCSLDNLVCPIGTDGKFRVKKCKKIGECDWKGNLLTQIKEA